MLERLRSEHPFWLLTASIVVVVVIVLGVAELYVNPEGMPQQVSDIRLQVLQIAAGAVGATVLTFGAVTAWNNYVVNQRRLDVDREGQVTERFTRAIDQLGATTPSGDLNYEVRLGAIYALTRIALDSDRDLVIIRDVLCAYMRHNVREVDFSTQLTAGLPPGPYEVDIDVETVLDVIGELVAVQSRPQLPPNLRGIPFSGYELNNRPFARCDLTSTRFQFTWLRFTDFMSARLIGAKFNNAMLDGTLFTRALLNGADFGGAHFVNGVDLAGADLRGARNLTASQLRGSVVGLDSAKLSEDLATELGLRPSESDGHT